MSTESADFSARFEHIRVGLAEARARGLKEVGFKSHPFALNPPLRLERVQLFEVNAGGGARLPEDYRRFLLEVGDGGPGPAHGLHKLSECFLGQFDPEMDEPRTFLVLPPFEPHLPYPLEAVSRWSYEALMQSSIGIASQGCTFDILLVIRGPHKGRVVYINSEQSPDVMEPYFAFFPDFLTWYETWLRELLAGYDVGYFGYGLPGTVAQWVDAVCNPANPLEIRSAALSSLLRVPTLEPELTARLQGYLPLEALSATSLLYIPLVQQQALNPLPSTLE